MGGEADIIAVRDIRIAHKVIAFAAAHEDDEMRAAVGVQADDHRIAGREDRVGGRRRRAWPSRRPH